MQGRQAARKQREPSLVGTAIDVLLNQTLDASYHGHGLPARRQWAERTWCGTVSGALTPLLAAGDVRTAAPHVLLLAAFHQAHRNIDIGLALRQALEQHEPKVVEDRRGALWQVADEDDLVALGTAALEDLAFASDAEQLVVNPVSGLSRRLGGADGDLIADGTLWDYKATATSRVVGRFEIWQLVAYLLADDTDSYGLDSVGVIALRWRTRLAWSAVQLLSDVSGDPPAEIDLVRWRAEFTEILPAARPRPRLGQPGPDAAVGDDTGDP